MLWNLIFCSASPKALHWCFSLTHLLFCVFPRYLFLAFCIFCCPSTPAFCETQNEEIKFTFQAGGGCWRLVPYCKREPVPSAAGSREGSAQLSEEEREGGRGWWQQQCLFLAPLRRREGKQTLLMQEDVAGPEGQGFKAAWDGICHRCGWLLLMWGKSESLSSPLAEEDCAVRRWGGFRRKIGGVWGQQSLEWISSVQTLQRREAVECSSRRLWQCGVAAVALHVKDGQEDANVQP